ncbi:hypothetical protein PLESTF_000964600 [Pleodorina starrii]|nr:hypothetical protein PLESTM_001899900 [Pleodorina starrii]GLC70358.1 hypothetical protein PLESTF_000964600 [Pleodorina starrii]
MAWHTRSSPGQDPGDVKVGLSELPRSMVMAQLFDPSKAGKAEVVKLDGLRLLLAQLLVLERVPGHILPSFNHDVYRGPLPWEGGVQLPTNRGFVFRLWTAVFCGGARSRDTGARALRPAPPPNGLSALCVLSAVLVMGDKLTWVNCLGLVVVISGVLLFNYHKYSGSGGDLPSGGYRPTPIAIAAARELDRGSDVEGLVVGLGSSGDDPAAAMALSGAGISGPQRPGHPGARGLLAAAESPGEGPGLATLHHPLTALAAEKLPPQASSPQLR